MEIYICSTVRHLLFGLYKSLNSDSKAISKIIFFHDYQGIDPEEINPELLPENIELILISRKSFVKYIKSNGFFGKRILFFALRSWSISGKSKLRLARLMSEYNPQLNLTSEIKKLYLYNDNNKMSRLFRLLSPYYSMVEDGMGNYVEHKIDSKFKQFVRYLTKKTPKKYVFGEQKQCNTIYAIHPEKLPNLVKHKGKKLVLSKNETVTKVIKSCFRLNESSRLDKKSIIIATQPTFNKIKGKLIDKRFFYNIYDSIIQHSKVVGLNPVLKLHPKENEIEYLSFKEQGIKFLSSKLPLEIYLLSSTEKINIISINSSAGIGMEEYCNIYKIIPDEELDNFVDILCHIEKDKDSLQESISIQLSKIS
ncbi:hypothetical protein [Vibrio metschnikovii]|jgi:hypothetical protein|uniref:hypothetical protein n=1 Tax=Vibrio metschnikovii TaxID=28172 RepID=UPI002FC76251